jgi:hypothetical protein
MTPVLIGLLVANAVFNALVWPSFYRRVAKDARARDESGRPTAFLRVHAALIAVALILAAASVVAAITAVVL